jgi:uncharacterized membrane protein
MRRSSLMLALTFGSTLVCATPTLAAFNICNKTNLPVRTAIGRFDGTRWTSEGWWTIQPRACTSVLTGALQARFYYLYASDGAAGTWEGKTPFCVAPNKRFESMGRGNCAERGFDRRDFFEVDTGDKVDWSQSLSN